MALLRSMILMGLLFAFTAVGAQTQTDTGYAPVAMKDIRLTEVRSGRPACIDLAASAKNTFVFVMLSPECPLCQQYTLQLNALAENYANEVQIIGLFPGKSYDRKSILSFVKKYKVKFPTYIDGSKKLTYYLDASVTPEVIILSTDKDRFTVRYQGAIDDRVISLRTKKVRATSYYLKDAIDQILLKEEVIVKRTEPVGCLINDF